MDATTCHAGGNRAVTGRGQAGVACPFCDGVLVPLRGEFRCMRCSFSICPGCDSSSLLDAGAAACSADR